MINKNYTQADHNFRDHDLYAQAKYQITLKWLEVNAQKGAVLVNVGCGAGYFNQQALQNGYKVIGYEPDRAAYLIAAQLTHQRLELVCGDLFSIPSTIQADIVVMHDVLEHIDAEDAAINKVYELLNDDGILVISVPALDQLFGFHDEQLGHFRRYSKTSLRRSLRNRFEVRRIRYLGFFALPGVYYFSRLRKRSYPSASMDESSGLRKIFGKMMTIERYFSLPLGTSVIVMARKVDKQTNLQ
jgi:SAM-dependent methyltransferase